MMEIHMTVGNVFKMIIEAIKELVAVGNLKCSGDKMGIQCMDSSHVALVDLVLTQDNFTHSSSWDAMMILLCVTWIRRTP
jgi:proliferating cell nuclear antigen